MYQRRGEEGDTGSDEAGGSEAGCRVWDMEGGGVGEEGSDGDDGA